MTYPPQHGSSQPDPSGQYPQPQPYAPPPGYQLYPAPPPPKKRSKALVWVLSVAGVLLVLCVIGAVASAGDDKVTVSPPKAAAPGAAGEPAEPAQEVEEGVADDSKTFNLAVGTEMTVTSDDGDVQTAILRSVKTFKKGCNSLDVDPEQGVFVVVDVLITQKKGTGSVNGLNFTFVGDDGTTSNSLSAAFSGCDEPSLGSTNSLRAGQKRSGKIAFDVKSASGSVEFAPGGLGADTVGSWKLNG